MPHEHCELWGYPGAGKSTVARLLQRRYGVRVTPLQPVDRGIAARTKRIVSQLSDPWLWSALTPPSTPLKTRKRVLSRLCYRQSATLSASDGPCLLEEGIVHEIWRLLYSHPDELAKSWWRDLVPRAAPVVLLLEVPPQSALERIGTKASPGPINRELLADPLGGERWARASDAYEALVRALEASESNRLVTVDATDADVDRVCARIVEALAATSPHRPKARADCAT